MTEGRRPTAAELAALRERLSRVAVRTALAVAADAPEARWERFARLEDEYSFEPRGYCSADRATWVAQQLAKHEKWLIATAKALGLDPAEAVRRWGRRDRR